MAERSRLPVAVGLACLAFGAARAVDLAAYGFLLSDSLDVLAGKAAAPDQYRYLPHLLMVGLAKAVGFRAALEVVIFVPLFTFLCLLMFVAWQDRPAIKRAAGCVFVALIYPLSMYAGARFDTALVLAFMLAGLCLWNRPALYLALIAIFSLCRADYALILALFVLVQAHEAGRPIAPYVAASATPVVAQAAFWLIFPSASYYTEVMQLGANLRGDVLGIPGFLYTLGVLVLVAAFVWKPLRVDRYAAAKLAVLLLYVLMILVCARAREWRLWLPLMPLAYGILCGPAVRKRIR